jgi:excisionase family DNA binding protein
MTDHHTAVPFDQPADEISLTPAGYRFAHLGNKADPSRRAMAGVGDWAQRIGRHILPDGSVAVPPRIAAWLESKAGVTRERRIAIRDTDPAAYEVLAALRLAALQYSSGTGTKVAGQQHLPQRLKTWVTTSTAAELLEVTDRAVRKWIATGRLPATRHGGRWLIHRGHLKALSLTD